MSTINFFKFLQGNVEADCEVGEFWVAHIRPNLQRVKFWIQIYQEFHAINPNLINFRLIEFVISRQSSDPLLPKKVRVKRTPKNPFRTSSSFKDKSKPEVPLRYFEYFQVWARYTKWPNSVRYFLCIFDWTLIHFRILKLVIGVVCSIHFLACLYFIISFYVSNDTAWKLPSSFQESSAVSAYIYCFY